MSEARWTNFKRTPGWLGAIRAFGDLTDAEVLEGEDTIFGQVLIFGVRHHVTFVKVTRDPQTGEQVGTNDPHERLDDILAGADGAGETVEIPGVEGDWVCGVDPHRR